MPQEIRHSLSIATVLAHVEVLGWKPQGIASTVLPSDYRHIIASNYIDEQERQTDEHDIAVWQDCIILSRKNVGARGQLDFAFIWMLVRIACHPTPMPPPIAAIGTKTKASETGSDNINRNSAPSSIGLISQLMH